MFGEEGGAEIDPASVSGSDNDCFEESVEEVNEPNTFRGCGCWRKMQCSGSWGVVGVRTTMLLKNKYGAIIFLCFWCFCVILF